MATDDSRSEPLSRPTAEARSVADLVAAARAGRLRIPPFQRRFRWDGGDIERLFESVWQGYPVGSLLFWERPAPSAHVDFGPVSVDAEAQSDALFVVDGQQRLTSLIGVLAAPEEVRGPFELYFDLAQKDFRRAGNRRPSATWFPLRLAIDTNGLLSWLLEFRERGGAEEHVETATSLGERIREYRIPVSIVRTDDESVLRDIFDRLNTFGRRLTRAEVFQALHAAIGEREPNDLADLVDEVAGLGFGTLREDTVLRSVLAVRGGDVFRDFRSEFAPDEDPAETYRHTSDALRRTVLFLQGDASIPHIRTLPYALVVPVLARFFALHPKPNDRTRVLLRRWVWRGAVSGVGGGAGATVAVRRAVQHVDTDEDASTQRLLETVDSNPQTGLDLDATQLNRAAARANLALLSSLEPRDFRSGDRIDVSSLLDSEDSGGPLRIPASSGRVETLASVFVHSQVADDELVDAISEAPEEVLASHAISTEAAEALREGRLDDFLALRWSALGPILTARRDALAEPGALDRPPIASLFLADEPA